MNSPVPIMDESLLSLLDELVPNEAEFREETNSSSSEQDFGAGDSVNDPNYVYEPNLPQPLTKSVRSMPSEADSSGSDMTPKSSTRKRQKNSEMWKQYLRKRLRESGKEYTNIKETNIKEIKVLEPCIPVFICVQKSFLVK